MYTQYELQTKNWDKTNFKENVILIEINNFLNCFWENPHKVFHKKEEIASILDELYNIVKHHSGTSWIDIKITILWMKKSLFFEIDNFSKRQKIFTSYLKYKQDNNHIDKERDKYKKETEIIWTDFVSILKKYWWKNAWELLFRALRENIKEAKYLKTMENVVFLDHRFASLIWKILSSLQKNIEKVYLMMV